MNDLGLQEFARRYFFIVVRLRSSPAAWPR